MITALILTGLLAHRHEDAWTLKMPYEKGKKVVWTSKIHATADGMDHDATMDLVLTPGDTAPGGRKVNYAWEKLELDGNPVQIPATYDVIMDDTGVVQDKTGTDEDEIRRYASIYSFSYPKDPVKVGDKWKVEVTPKASGAQKITYTFEVKEATKVKDKDVLKITSVETEAGSSGIHNEGTWYVNHDGAIVKFKLDVTNWVVPFAGSQAAVNAVIEGETQSK